MIRGEFALVGLKHFFEVVVVLSSLSFDNAWKRGKNFDQNLKNLKI